MSKKLTIQSVNAAHQAAADANTKANEALEALRARLRTDSGLAQALAVVVGAISQAVACSATSVELCSGVTRFRAELEPTANSYGYTLADHPIRRDLVVVQPL